MTSKSDPASQSNISSQLLLEYCSSGKLLILHPEASTGLILKKKDYCADLITAGSAIGGQFDTQVVDVYTIGDVRMAAPEDEEDLQQAISNRQNDIDQMEAFYKERDLFKRASAILETLNHSYGADKVRAIPKDLLALLAGTNVEVIHRAWGQVFGLTTETSPEPQPAFFSTLKSASNSAFEKLHSVPFLHPAHQSWPEAETTTAAAIPSQPKRRIWWLTGATALAAVGLTVGTSLMFRGGQSPTNDVSVAVNPPAISALGFIEPQGEVKQLSAPASTERARISQLFVRQGDIVHKGDVVAILDNRDRLQAALDQARQNVAIAQSKLAQVKAGAKKGEIRAQEAQYLKNRAELSGQINTQQATIANLEAGMEGDINTQESVILQNKAELDYARIECGRYQTLYKKRAVSASRRDSTCLAQITAQERLAQASSALDRTINTRTQQIHEARSNLQRIINTLENEIAAAGSSRDALAEVRGVDLQVATSELIATQSAVKKAQADLDQAYVRAPVTGQILKINTWPGEQVQQDKGIIELGQTDQMYVSTQVYETDVSRVRAGQKATIKADGVVGSLEGTVEQIGLRIGRPNALGTDPVKDADVRVVEVKIRLSPKDSAKVKALTNLQVNVVIQPRS